MITSITEPKNWQAIFNKIEIKFQRKDYKIQKISSSNIYLNSVDGLQAGDNIYIKTLHEMAFVKISVINSFYKYILVGTSVTDQTGAGGFVNCEMYNGVNKYWNAEILINNIATKRVNSDIYGLCTVDISKNLLFLFTIENTDDYLTKYRADNNLGISYNLAINEYSQDAIISTLDAGTFYGTLGALTYSDLSDYLLNYDTSHHGLFLTEFDELKYWNNKQFDISLLVNANVTDIKVNEELHFLNGTTTTNQYSLPAYDNKLVRLSLEGNYTNVKYINFYLTEGTVTITDVKRINVHESCNGVNVHWINMLGGLDNWVFENMQKKSVITKADTVIFKDKELDYKKTAHEEITVFLENEDVKYLAGLERLLYALQIFIDNEPVRIKTGTFKTYETNNNKFSLSCTFIKKELNLGHL